MSVRAASSPSYRRHRPSGQAVVTIAGRDFYLGRHGSPESHAEYDRRISEWLARGRRLPGGTEAPAPSVNELILAYLKFADGYYVKAGRPTKEPSNIRGALKPLRLLSGLTTARDFGPLALKAVRAAYVAAGLCRNEVNRRTRIVVRAFKWAAENELVPASVHHGLKAVAGLRKGRGECRESEPVRPVPDALVDAIRPHVARQVWAMVELQRLTGMRPGEVTAMRTGDLDTSGAVWAYTPGSHKTEHHGRARVIYLGPRAQEVVRPWLRPDPGAFLFQPREATAERLAARRAARKTPVQPSQADRSKPKPRRAPGDRYTAGSYLHAIGAGCDKASPPPAGAGGAELGAWRKAHRWHPNRLRHNAATRLRREFGLDVARAILGHATAATTEIYAEVDGEKARAVMGQVG